MRTIWHSLAWKEWHEHKWKLAALVATLWGVVALLSHDGDKSYGALIAIRIVLVICIVPLAVFVGLGSAAGERSRGTLPFMQALPVPMWRVALSKVVFGLATLAGAALFTLALVYLMNTFLGVDGSRTEVRPNFTEPFSFGISNWYCDSALAIVSIAFSFYIWTIACGVNRRDEVSAGAVALVIMISWTVLVAFGMDVLFSQARASFSDEIPKLVSVVGLSTVPGGFMTMTNSLSSPQAAKFLGVGINSAAATHLVLAVWYVQRFGRITNLEVRSPQAARRSDSLIEWLGLPRRSGFTSTVWKQYRESGPIVAAGLAGIIGVTASLHLTESWERGRMLLQVGEMYNAIALTLGFVMAIVIGIGVCFYDVQPQLNAFWRSRPIQPDLWFWCKYITGLVVLLTAIYAPILLIWFLGDTSGMDKFNFPDAYVLPVAHVAVFAAAVAMTCLVRHAIYAAILSIGFMYLCAVLAYSAWFVAALVGWAKPNSRIWTQPTLAQGASALVTSIVVSTLLAWLAMRYDWGRKSRY